MGSLFSERLGEETKDSSMLMEGEEGEPKTDMEVVTHMYDVNPTVREVCITQPLVIHIMKISVRMAYLALGRCDIPNLPNFFCTDLILMQ